MSRQGVYSRARLPEPTRMSNTRAVRFVASPQIGSGLAIQHETNAPVGFDIGSMSITRKRHHESTERKCYLNIALLIDCENPKPASIDGILGELAEKGTINIRRACGNWKDHAGWEEKLPYRATSA